jgi:hypothetical protein
MVRYFNVCLQDAMRSTSPVKRKTVQNGFRSQRTVVKAVLIIFGSAEVTSFVLQYSAAPSSSP